MEYILATTEETKAINAQVFDLTINMCFLLFDSNFPHVFSFFHL